MYIFCGIYFLDSEVENIIKKFRNHEFISLGTNKPDFIDQDIINICEEKNKNYIEKKILRIAESNDNDNINIIEEAKNITIEDLEKYFNDLSLEADKQEVNLKRLISRMDEFNQVFDKEIELAFKNSIF